MTRRMTPLLTLCSLLFALCPAAATPTSRKLPKSPYRNLAAAFASSSSQYLSKATNSDLESGDIDFTVACWVYLESISANRTLFAKWDTTTSSQREYRLYYNQAFSDFGFECWQFTTSTLGGVGDTDGAAPAAGRWYFVVGWHDSVGNTVNCQVNDTAAGSVAFSAGITANSVEFRIGAQVGVQDFLDGRIDSYGFWKRVLTADEKTFLYNAGRGRAYRDLTPDLKTSLIRWWDMDATFTDKVSAELLVNNAGVTFTAGKK